MSGTILFVAAAAVGVDFGWQPVAGGGIEYIIQIEPEMLDALREGADIKSDVPPFLRGVRTYRITVGRGQLPHEGEPPPDNESPPEDPTPPEVDLADFPLPGPDLSPETAADEFLAADDLSSAKGTGPTGPEPEAFEAETPSSPLVKPCLPAGRQAAGYREESEPKAKAERKHSLGAGESAEASEPASPSDRQADSPPPDRAGRGQAARPWLPFTATLVGLFASLGGNAYLFWVALAQRSRYRALAKAHGPTSW